MNALKAIKALEQEAVTEASRLTGDGHNLYSAPPQRQLGRAEAFRAAIAILEESKDEQST